MNWIKVEDGLPEESGDSLLMVVKWGTGRARWWQEGQYKHGYWRDCNDDRDEPLADDLEVTHWARPELPEEELEQE